MREGGENCLKYLTRAWNRTEMSLNVVITEKIENQYVSKIMQVGILRTQGVFSDKVTQDVDGFTDEPVVQYDVRVVKHAFVDDSK